ncbi:DUF2087 domain-containing protein [Paenibacillus campi]|uniref:DUF2087 domain-containing protein n=1 Tax=Paenibacillus campi TaxID=3106031 RepID=UPI002AFEED21|nr:DUF2087 domain-containing protein [Paenibacillus sp. SGZ-1009]
MKDTTNNKSISQNKQLSERFWQADLLELKRGYVEDEQASEYGSFVCLIDGQMFEKGRIYEQEGAFYEAERFMQMHIRQQYGSMFHYLLTLDKKWTGLTELQSELVRAFYEGQSDTDITAAHGGSKSTIRNHRFALREKAKQARVFLAIMDMLEEQQNDPSPFVSIHRTATMLDERYAVTEQENEAVLRQYFKQGTDGPLAEFPRKEKRKIIILRQLIRRFEVGRTYTEKQVNEVLAAAYADYVTLRRYMIAYGFMDRQDDGSAYWVKR